MRRVALIYNPASGQYSARRNAAVSEIKAVLSEAGVEAEAFETGAPGSAVALAEQAARNGFDTILACGGDGTVHEVVQSLVGTDVALGVVPRSEERRVGKECLAVCRSRWSPYH